MGFAGSTMPFFRPNFDNVEQLRQELNQGQETSNPGSSNGGDTSKSSNNRSNVSDGDGSKSSGSVVGRGGGVLGRPVGAVLAFIPTGWGAKASAMNQSNGAIFSTISSSNGSSNTVISTITASATSSNEEGDEKVEVQFSPHGGLGPARHQNGVTVQVASQPATAPPTSSCHT